MKKVADLHQKYGDHRLKKKICDLQTFLYISDKVNTSLYSIKKSEHEKVVKRPIFASYLRQKLLKKGTFGSIYTSRMEGVSL